jgi:hypothetical protein
MSADPAPVVISPAQREALDDLERKAYGHEGGWVPADHLNGQAHMAALVSRGLVEEKWRQSGGGNGANGHGVDEAVPSYRRDPKALFVVVHPRGRKPGVGTSVTQ